MDLSFSSDTVVTVLTIIAPGYFMVQAYSAVNAKPEKNFSRTLVESIAFGFLLVGVYNLALEALSFSGQGRTQQLNYLLPLLILAPLLGILVGNITDTRPARWLRTRLRLPGPDDDYLRVLFKGIKSSAYVTVELKDGKIFSGTPEGWSTYTPQAPQRIYFNNVAWYKQSGKRHVWNTRNGSLIITTDSIAYIETGTPIKK